jgi:hypothetical protein
MSQIIDLVKAGLQFSKTEIGAIAEKESYTQAAVSLLSFSVLLDVVIAFFKGNGGSSGIANLQLSGATAAVAQLGSLLIGIVLSAYLMTFVLRLFDVETTFDAILRIYGSAIVWTIIASVITALLGGGVAAMVVGILCWFAYNFAVLFGLAEFTKLPLWKSFASIVLTFIGVFVCILAYGAFLKVILAT